MEPIANINKLKGPILIIGASGFVGNNIFRSLSAQRQDVYGTTYKGTSWRLTDVNPTKIKYFDSCDHNICSSLLDTLRPLTVFDCSSFGAYSFETNISKVHETNYLGLINILEKLRTQPIEAYIHAGSSSEYGYNCSGPSELTTIPLPNSHYAVSKVAAGAAISHYGKTYSLPTLNLRLYSVYGPYEDSSRLIPNICRASLSQKLPKFAGPHVSRDFIHVNDVVQAFVNAALMITPEIYGDSFNIGSGNATTLSELAKLSREIFNIGEEPAYSSDQSRDWDTDNWYADISRAKKLLSWTPAVPLKHGLFATQRWWSDQLSTVDFNLLTKKTSNPKNKSSISAIIACYKDADAIPVMYDRLRKVFITNNIDYEIIFVNDCSPDNTSDIITAISSSDPCVIGINHSRNFGSQAAFRSGMKLATKEAVVLLDGDLQDPPEIIPSFIKKWRSGADVVYGRRRQRQMGFIQLFIYRSFYRVFSLLSDIPMPRDAGDFSLIDRRVVYWILNCQERDSLIRGLRAYVGFNQVAVDYYRPERMFGSSTNNLIKNLGWAKMAIFSFSQLPLHALTALGLLMLAVTILIATYSLFILFVFPDQAPRGITFLILLVLLFGSSTLLGLGILGEYIGKILAESKQRPPYIPTSLIRDGQIISYEA